MRALCLYNPYAAMLLHGKIETRWVQIGRKPPFPLGEYLIYSSQKPLKRSDVIERSGATNEALIRMILEREQEPAMQYNGYALLIADLVAVRAMEPHDDKYTFTTSQVLTDRRQRFCLDFQNVRRIEPFKWNYGKQGIGFVPDSELSKIKPLSNHKEAA